ncbi:MAG: SMP-30/gluconolactonase/LRE family protein [Proteobacteria bacterium]|nr:SMP-30/gluconolactonase/LRE family protein [Pseudomonadota bacterium]
MQQTPDVRTVLAVKALNGERPGWSIARQRLFWVDIRGPNLHEFNPVDGTDRFWEMPSWIGCHALTSAGAVVALRTGLYHFDIEADTLTATAVAPFDTRRFIFNDGRCDRRGRLFAGTMYVPLNPAPDLDDAAQRTPLWRYDGNGRWSEATPPVATSNGLAWSPDGRRMYHADTARKRIWCYEYDEATGTAANRAVFADLSDSAGAPDGATVDRDGFYWCAVYGGGELRRYDPAGVVERRVAMPTIYPTMPALGGADLTTMFVTSANWQLPKAQRGRTPDGDLFAFEAPCPGLPPSLFDATKLPTLRPAQESQNTQRQSRRSAGNVA